MGVFIAQFFNTGFVLMLANANLTETYIPILNRYITGQYTDFSSGWYRDVGATIVKTMAISAVMPVVEFGMFYVLRNALRKKDRNFTNDYLRTQKKSIQQYIDIYSGPEFMIHFRYSTIMNTVFVCLMYGTALPILYPIALMSFVILYILERLLVFYYYKQPPVFDEKMTMNSISMMLWAPFFYMAFSYWFLGNN